MSGAIRDAATVSELEVQMTPTVATAAANALAPATSKQGAGIRGTGKQGTGKQGTGKQGTGNRQARDKRINGAPRTSGPPRRERQKTRRGWIAGGAVAALATLFAAGVTLAVFAKSESSAVGPEQARMLAVRTVTVQPVTSYQTPREYTGAIVARRSSQLGFELAGMLTQLHVEDGDRIAQGDVLGQLDTEHLAVQRRQVVAKRAQAAALLEEMVTGARIEDIAAARARVESQQAQVELLKLQTARQKRLVSARATSQNEYEQFAFGLKAREAQLAEASHDLEELLNGTRKERVAAQRAVVAELDAAIANIDIDLRKSRLRAPFGGTIARRLADEGTVVEKGQPVFRLVEDHVLEAWVGLPASATGAVRKGASLRVKIHGEQYTAEVARLFPVVDPATRTRTVVLRLDEAAVRHAVHGQVVRLQLEETVQAEGFWLPSTALAKGARGLWTAFVVEPNDDSGSLRVGRRELEVLHIESDRALVRGTLNSGDRVIAGGTHRVTPGQLVRVARQSESQTP